MKKIISFICFILLLSTPATHADGLSESPAKQYINSLTTHVPTITAQQLQKALVKGTNNVVLLDVRTFYERYQTKTILGDKEVHIPRGFLEVKAWDGLPRDKMVVVYCSKGTRSKLAVNTLMDMGWTEISSLQGGVKAWYELLDKPCDCLPDEQEIPDKAMIEPEECKP